MTTHRPGPDEVHIRLLNLALREEELTRLRRLLAPDERERADRLLTLQGRSRFIAGRGQLRETLADYLNRDPADLHLTANQYGKPFLSLEQDNPGLSFNLSHSGDLAIIALAKCRQIGIDLEQLRADLPFRSMALQFFSQREQAELFSLPADLQPAAFYRCWTRKEAYLKGCGSGFAQSADSCDVSLFPGQPPVLHADRINPAHSGLWSLTDIDVPEGFRAALAVQGQPPTIIHFQPA